MKRRAAASCSAGSSVTGDGGETDQPDGGARTTPAGVQDASREAERLQQSWGSVTAAVDAIRARYGGSAVGPASLVTPEGIKVRQRGEAQWGPTRPGGRPGGRPDGDDAPTGEADDR